MKADPGMRDFYGAIATIAMCALLLALEGCVAVVIFIARAAR